MPRTARLVLLWGPDAQQTTTLTRSADALLAEVEGPHVLVQHFHAGALEDNPHPFASRFFGAVVWTLLEQGTVLLSDSVFEDEDRRALVERCFTRTLPGLVVEHVRLESAESVLRREHPGLVLDDDVYGEGEHASHESVVVTSEAPQETLVAALGAAAARMTCVGEDGREYADVEEAATKGVYTPNYVSDVEVDERGRVGFYLDCKGAIEPPMAARLRQVLLEELVRHGVTRAHVRVPADA
ncbi:hypothetical protein [Nocardioides solisilvae]|uniref:hypothetical protein n=1 Tax=Nocardioides solisilvae TaxID=1542435 RepID=UPI001EF636C7|nr:hypothetical protein [Nocardioides solisilvae]